MTGSQIKSFNSSPSVLGGNAYENTKVEYAVPRRSDESEKKITL